MVDVEVLGGRGKRDVRALRSAWVAERECAKLHEFGNLE